MLRQLIRYSALATLALAPAAAFAGSYNYDFGTGTGTHSSATSTTFLPTPSSGTTYVRIGSGAGTISLSNPGPMAVGSGTQLVATAPTGGSVNKVGFTGIAASTPTNCFYNKYNLRLSGGSSGTWYYFMGTGAQYSDANTFTGSQVYSGLQFVFGASGAITANYRNGSGWTALSPNPFAQATDYTVEIYANNTAGSVTYGRNSTNYTLATNKWDMWVNGTRTSALNKAQLAAVTAMDGFMFYGESSTGNVAQIAVDNISYGDLPAGDTVAPTISTRVPASAATTNSLASVSVTFSESVTGVAASNLTVGGSAATAVTGSGAGPYVFSGYTAPSQGTVNIALAAGSIADAFANAFVATNWNITYDTLAPTISSRTPAAASSVNSVGSVSVTFAESVTGVTASNLTVNGSAATAVTGSGVGPYSFSGFTAPATGTVNFVLAAGAIADTATNAFAGASWSATYDTVAPTVSSIVRASTDPVLSGTGSSNFTVTFSEAVTGVAASNFATSGTASGTIGTPTGSGTTWTVPVTWSSNTVGVLGINLTSAGSIRDAANNALGSLPFNAGQFYTVDRKRPTLTSVTYLDPIPTSATSYRIQFGFDEPVTNFTPATFAATLQVTGATGAIAANSTAFFLGASTAVAGSGTNTVVVTTTLGAPFDGTVSSAFFYASGGITDLLGNQPNIPVVIPTLTLDYTVPTLSLTTTSPLTTNAAPFTVTAAFSEPVTGFGLGKVNVGNGIASNLVASSSTLYRFTVTPAGDGPVTIDAAAGAGLDVAFNPSPAVTQLAITYDTTPPAVVIGSPSDMLTRTGPVSFPVTYTGASTVTLANANITVNATGNAAASSVVVSGTGTTTRTVTLSGITGDGTLGISVAAGTAVDAAGNTAVAAGPGATFTVDNTAPTVAIGAPSPAATNSGPVDFTVNYTGASTVTLAAGDITVNKTGTADYTSLSILGSGTATRTVRLSGVTGDGTLGISLAAGTANDVATNAAPATGPSATAAVDNTAPTVTISAPSSPTASTGPVTFTVTYAGATSATLTPGNIAKNLTGTANGTIGVTGTGTGPFTVTVSGITGDGSIGISIPAGTAVDAVGNTAPAAGPSDAFAVGNTLPAVDIGTPSASITRGGPVTYAISYSNATSVTLSSTNVSVVATGTAAAAGKSLTGSGFGPYTVTLSGITGDGTLGISLPANTATNSGQPAPAATGLTFAVDNTSPTVAVSAPDVSPVRGGPVSFDVFFSEAVTTLPATGIVVNRTGTVTTGTVATSGSGTSFTVTLTGLAGDGTVGIRVPAAATADAAGNGNFASADSATATVDNTAPVATVGAASASPVAGGPVSFPVTFNEPVTGFSLESDVIVVTTGSVSAASAAIVGGGTSFTVTLSGLSGDGQIAIRVKAGAALDAAGNANGLSPVGGATTVDNTAPSVVSVVRAAASPTNAASVAFSVTFSEPVTGVAASNFTAAFAGGAAGSLGTVTGSGASYTVPVNVNSGTAGTVKLNVTAAGTVADAAANALSGLPYTAGETYTVDRVAPGVALSSTVGAYASGPFAVAADFTEPVTGFTTAGLTLVNATVSGFSGSGDSYAFVVTPSGNGAVSVQVTAGAAVDSVGNAATASNTVATAADLAAPVSAASTTDATQVGTTVSVTFAAADAGGSGLATTRLFARAPGAGSFSDTGLTFAGADGTFVYTASAGNGVYGFATAATDAAGNVETLPGTADTTISVNTVLNGAYAVTVPPGGGSFVFPMTSTLDTTITLAGGAGGTLTVARFAPRGTTPAFFQVPGSLIGEQLAISAGGGLSGFTAALEWGYDPAGAAAIGGPVTRVYAFDGGATPSATYTPIVAGGVITVGGITGFSDWFAGTPVAVPVAVSAIAID